MTPIKVTYTCTPSFHVYNYTYLICPTKVDTRKTNLIRSIIEIITKTMNLTWTHSGRHIWYHYILNTYRGKLKQNPRKSGVPTATDNMGGRVRNRSIIEIITVEDNSL
jgi:hypothetical protein